MKLLIALCFTAALFAGDQQAKTDDQTKAKTEAAEKPLTEIPASAVEFEPGSYRYADAKGKKWILRPTPFGIAKIEDTGKPLPKKGEEDHSIDGVKVSELGDSVRFVSEGENVPTSGGLPLNGSAKSGKLTCGVPRKGGALIGDCNGPP